MAELAIISSNNSKMAKLAKTNKGAQTALNLMNNPASFLSTIQIGITIIGIISGAFSGQRFAEPFGNILNHIPWFLGYRFSIAFILVITVVTYISIVFGELIPKYIAISNPEKIAILLGLPIFLLSKMVHPFVLLLESSTKFILKLFDQENKKTLSITQEEIDSVINQGFQDGVIDDFEHRVFQKILQFGDREISIIMTPRIKVVYLDINDANEKNIEKIIKNPHRYYPVVEGSLDNFKGIIDIKDAFSQQIQQKNLDLKALIKQAPCVFEDNLGTDLLDQLKAYKTHIAVVVDEYGTMQGIVTLVDILETLVGSMPESHQEKHYKITLREDGSWLCDGLTPIDEIEEILEIRIIENFAESDFNTLAGFLLIHFKLIPQEGKYVDWQNFRFEIIDMDNTRIDKVLISKKF